MRVLAFGTMLVGLLSGVGPISLHGQGTFQNLDFEAAQLIPTSGGLVRFDAAFPGWTGYFGNQTVTQTRPNGLPLAFDHDPFIAICTTSDFDIPQGQYMVCLGGGYGYIPSPNYTSASIAQTGIVPADAKSIRFFTVGAYSLGGSLNIGGVPVPLVRVGGNPGSYDIWGGDISAFAGQMKELRFTAGWLYVDDIQFSNQLIPEPSAFGLLGLGALFLGWRLRRRRSA